MCVYVCCVCACAGLTPEEAAEKPFLASMGIYVFKKEALLELLQKTCADVSGGAGGRGRRSTGRAGTTAPFLIKQTWFFNKAEKLLWGEGGVLSLCAARHACLLGHWA